MLCCSKLPRGRTVEAGRGDLCTRSEKEGDEHMRRIAMLLGLMVALMVVAAGVALAVEYRVEQCRDDPCKGTAQRDMMYEHVGNDVQDHIYGLDAGDRLDAGNFGSDRDVLFGGPRGDVLIGLDGDGADSLRGGRGRDRCVADDGDNLDSCRRVEIQSAEGQAILAGSE